MNRLRQWPEAPSRPRPKRRLARRWLLLVGLSALALAPAAKLAAEQESPKPVRDSEGRLLRHGYSSACTGRERDAHVYLPAGYGNDSEHRWPVLVFLHGHGERGDGKGELDWVLAQGPLYEAWIQRRELPFVIVAPQLPMFGQKTSAPYLEFRDDANIPRRLDHGVPARPEEFATPDPMRGALAAEEIPLPPTGPPDGWNRCEMDVLSIIDEVQEKFATDRDRVYLTGLSYGGFGTWYLASRHPERFAAIAPVVGWGHPDLMPPLAAQKTPIWVFAGGRDSAVKAEFFYAGLNALERLGHLNVRFTIHEDMGHDVWERVYGGRDLYDWLLSHRRETGAAAGKRSE